MHIRVKNIQFGYPDAGSIENGSLARITANRTAYF